MMKDLKNKIAQLSKWKGHLKLQPKWELEWFHYLKLLKEKEFRR